TACSRAPDSFALCFRLILPRRSDRSSRAVTLTARARVVSAAGLARARLARRGGAKRPRIQTRSRAEGETLAASTLVWVAHSLDPAVAPPRAGKTTKQQLPKT